MIPKIHFHFIDIHVVTNCIYDFLTDSLNLYIDNSNKKHNNNNY